MKYILLPLIILTLLYSSSQYIINYRCIVSKHRLISEKFNITRAMIEKNNYKILYSFKIDTMKNKNLLQILKKNRDIIIENLFKQDIILTDNSTKNRFNIKTKTILTIPNQYILVDDKKNFIDIFLIE